MRIMVIVHPQSDLLQTIFACRPAGCFAGLLYSRQQQRHQNRDDRNHDQELNKCETSSSNSFHNEYSK